MKARWPARRIRKNLTECAGLYLILSLTTTFATPPSPDTACAWASLAERDSLTVLFQGRPMGSLIYSIEVSRNAITERTLMRVSPTAQVTGIGSMTVEEVRRYDAAGVLTEADQRMESVAGASAWRLRRSPTGGWNLRVNTGGVENQRAVPAISENLAATRAIKCGILGRSLSPGQTWDDTSFDLTSAQTIAARTVCKERPSAKNRYRWVFVNRNSLTQRDERWELDTSGRTVYQEIPPYFEAVATGAAATSRTDSLTSVDLMDQASIRAERAARPGERIALTLDSGATMHPSIIGWYTRSKEQWVLRALPETCGRKVPATVPDSLRAFTVATPVLQSGDSRIIALARTLGTNDACATIRVMNAHVYSSLVKRNTATFSSAVETLKAGYGDCGEHAVLLAALLRAAGIPARVVYGMVYLPARKGYYYHAWVTAWAGEWVFADPSHGVFPAFRDRIPLIIDDAGENLLHLGSLIARIRIEYSRTQVTQ